MSRWGLGAYSLALLDATGYVSARALSWLGYRGPNTTTAGLSEPVEVRIVAPPWLQHAVC
jgi:hypothetical protein